MQSFRIFYFLYKQDYEVYSDSIHYPNRFICIVLGDSDRGSGDRGNYPKRKYKRTFRDR